MPTTAMTTPNEQFELAESLVGSTTNRIQYYESTAKIRKHVRRLGICPEAPHIIDYLFAVG
jgi:hypothetical protein